MDCFDINQAVSCDNLSLFYLSRSAAKRDGPARLLERGELNCHECLLEEWRVERLVGPEESRLSMK
jgi:hypothetical protein